MLATSRLDNSSLAESRVGHKASSSSTKITAGADCRAWAKMSRSFCSASPTNRPTTSGPLMARKRAWPHASAMALAISVFPSAGREHGYVF
jgi:hypothetical protein